MDKKLFVLNLLFAVSDLLFSALTVLVVAWAANYFQNLWILLFLIVPVVLFHSHSVILNADISQAGGGENDGKT